MGKVCRLNLGIGIIGISKSCDLLHLNLGIPMTPNRLLFFVTPLKKKNIEIIAQNMFQSASRRRHVACGAAALDV